MGAYTSAVLSAEYGLTPWLGMFVGAALATALGAMIGYLGFRLGLRGFYFVLLTVAFAEVCRILVSNIDAVVIAERPKIAPHVETMRRNLAEAVGIDVERVSVKGKTNEGVGEIGRGEAIAAHAVALIETR